ncbi:MAG: hypothetical protein HYY16_16490 [Planctomycetes bacterium]|nr:hypothetical protein [Planctomycetota bacterium]
MGLGDFFDYETRIRNAVDEALDKNLAKVPGLFDDGLNKLELRTEKMLDDVQARIKSEVDDALKKVEGRSHELLDTVQDRLRAATATFFTDLEQRWERRLEAETRVQFKLLNRVLLYTFVVALISLGYALARVKLGW